MPENGYFLAFPTNGRLSAFPAMLIKKIPTIRLRPFKQSLLWLPSRRSSLIFF
jgi:hypothetical protein